MAAYALFLSVALFLGSLVSCNAILPRSGYTAPAYIYTTRNASAIFGYLLVGSHYADVSLGLDSPGNLTASKRAACKDMTLLSHRRWEGLAIDTYFIQKIYCDQIGWDHDYDLIASNIKFFNTGVFISQLINSFESSLFNPNSTASTLPNGTDTNPYIYLHKALNPYLLELYNLQSTRVKAAIASASNMTTTIPSPTPYANTTSTRVPLLKNFLSDVSTLFGYFLISSSDNFTQADELCKKGEIISPSLPNMRLDGPAIMEQMCGIEGRRLSGEEALIALRLWSTKAYADVLENVSDEPRWRDWLCGNLSPAAMNVTGLDGGLVSRRVCGKET